MSTLSPADLWSLYAPLYGSTVDSILQQWAVTALHLIPSCKEHRTFLDVACGAGCLTIAAMATKKFETTSVDFSEGMIATIREKLLQMGASEAVERCFVEDGLTLASIPDSSFDVVGSTFGIFMFSKRDKGWKSALRVLKPGGLLVATSWEYNSPNFTVPGLAISRAHGIIPPTSQDSSCMDESSRFLPSAIQNVTHADSFVQEVIDCGFEVIPGQQACFRVTHPFVLASGEDCVKMFFENPMMAHRLPTSLERLQIAKRVLLESFLGRKLTRKVSSTVPEVSSSTQAEIEFPVEESEEWSRPFLFHSTALIVLVRKPLSN